MKRWIGLGVAAVMLLQSPALIYGRAPEDFIVEGEAKVVKANEGVNINPYNLAKITGVGESGAFRVVGVYETFDIPLDTPLYRLSENYRDQILFEDGQWGVKRMVAVKTFDGSEDWSLLDSPGYQNNNTTIFKCANPIPAAPIWDGLSTHFDVFSRDEQKNNRYDGISFGRDNSEFYMRIMNVRKVTTVEELKTYLKAQQDAGTPVKFLFAMAEPVFEPFDEEIQQKLNQADLSQLGFVDKNLERISKQPEITINEDIFPQGKTDDEELNRFLASIVDLKIFNGSKDVTYYIEGVYKTNNQSKQLYQMGDGIIVVIRSSNGDGYLGTLETAKASFTKEKPAEVILKSDGNADESMRILFNLSKADYPTRELGELSSYGAVISDACVVEKELVLPQYLATVDGINTAFYLHNAILYGQSMDDAQVLETFSENTEILTVPKDAGTGVTRTVLFLGDSLINQDLYTEKLMECFQEDSMKLQLIGTRGAEENRHEGRGGWAAYDYCNVETKYGYTNPFLNGGKFDFGYYMKQNQYEQLDSVVINLGINDLNLIGHNSHDEILGYFDQIIKSIHSYNPNIKILLNAPTMLYADENTDTAKNQRLEFIKSLTSAYGGKEEENIWIIPAYLSLNPQMSFKQIEPVIDEYNQDHSLIVTDTTHPNNLGYEALAKMTHSYLKLVEWD